MPKFTLIGLCSFFVCSIGFAGQETGGGPKAISSELAQTIFRPELNIDIRLLGLPTRSAVLDEYRRTNARLSVWPQASLRTTTLSGLSETLEVKNLDGAIVDVKEIMQVLPEQTQP